MMHTASEVTSAYLLIPSHNTHTWFLRSYIVPEFHCIFYVSTSALDSQTISPLHYVATELEDIGQDIVTLADKEEEFSPGYVTQKTESEAQGAVEIFSFSSQHTVKTDEHDTTLFPFDSIHTTTTNRHSLTTPAIYGQRPEPTQSHWQEVLIKTIDSEAVPKIHLEPSWNYPKSADNQDKETHAANTGENTDNHTYYQPMPNVNLVPGEQVENETFTESKPNTTMDTLEPLYDFKEIRGSESKPETNLDDQDVHRHSTVINAQAGNISLTLESDASSVFRNQTTSSEITEGSGSEPTMTVTEKIGPSVTFSQDHFSSLTTTESFFLEDLSKPTLSK